MIGSYENNRYITNINYDKEYICEIVIMYYYLNKMLLEDNLSMVEVFKYTDMLVEISNVLNNAKKHKLMLKYF